MCRGRLQRTGNKTRKFLPTSLVGVHTRAGCDSLVTQAGHFIAPPVVRYTMEEFNDDGLSEEPNNIKAIKA